MALQPFLSYLAVEKGNMERIVTKVMIKGLRKDVGYVISSLPALH